MNNIDSNGNTFEEIQPWYKKWWIWLIIIMLALLGKIGYQTILAPRQAEQNASELTKGFYKYDDHEFSVIDKRTYKPNYEYTKWKGGTIKIYEVKVYKIRKTRKFKNYDDEYKMAQGFMTIYMSINASKNISVDPSGGTVILSNLEECDPEDDYKGFDNDIKAGQTHFGHFKIPIKHLKSISHIRALRFDFDVTAANDNDDSLNKTVGLIVRLRH